MQQILKTYQKRLINISANNRSLLLRKLLKDQFIDLHDFDFAHNKPSFSIIHDLISGKAKTKLCDLADSRDESVNLLSKRLRRLSRREKLLFEEHGSKDLYVGWPFLAGKFSDGTPVRCPLMFFPVEIEMTDKGWVLRQREDVNITLNKVFLIAYGHYNEVKISEELLERVFEDFDTDSMVFRTGLYHLFKESPVEINFNQDNFIDKLERFKEYNKQDFDEAQKIGSIKLFPEAVLGIFPQSGSYLVPDYEFIIEDQSFSDLAEFFEARLPQEIPGDRYGFLSKVKEEETYTPFKMDAYQENAIKAIKKGMSVVIQGPPGTGKSQVICNLISDYIARGKKVLVVCQKRAALDVVYKRFEDLELSDFLGLIHDFKNDRKELYHKIDKQIKNIEQYKLSINSLDALQLERQFQQCSRKIDQITEELEELKTALYDEQEAGISVKELYLTSNLAGDGINLKQEYKNFNFHSIQDNFSRLRNYLAYLKKFGKPDYPLLDRQSFAGYTIAALRRMQEQLAEINNIHEEIATTTTEIAGSEITLEDCRTILDKKELTKEFLSLITNDSIYEQLKNLMRIKSGEEHQQWFTTHSTVVLEALSGDGIESTLEKEEIGSFQKALHAAIVARTNFFKFLHWKLFNKDRAWVIAIIEKNKLSVNRDGLKSLTTKVDNRLNLEHNLTLIHEKGWLEPFRGKLSYKAIGQWVSEINKAFRAKAIFSSLRNFSEYFAVQQLTAKQLIDKIDKLYKGIDQIPKAWDSWQLYFSDVQLRKLSTDTSWYNQFKMALERDFESLCEFDTLKQELSSYELAVVDLVYNEYPDKSVEEMMSIVDNSIRLQWIEHIETKYPVLRAVSSMKFGQLEKELQDNVREKLKISQEILALRVKERTYSDAEYNRLNNMVTYRELGHQVNKQRRIWPLRKLIANFHEELYDLLPCWLASPETVSAVFPMASEFDLVIFDEASQCFTERGIPAMYRGKQVVVAGDNKQLRPNDLYQTRIEEDSDELALEVDSLLDLTSQYLMGVHLRGHYRSKKPELIEFSNHNFYNDQLRMLPDRILVNNKQAAIEYIKVKGVWEKQANLIEAERVIELIQELVSEQPEKDIGIVTFNVAQQDLILDLLDNLEIAGTFDRPKSLIVKNIENIQGDEKDIIIFSTAYAPDSKGKLTMQFGSLNLAGGENRLNVAITRAKEKIYLVSSIWPQELKVAETRNDGPKMLKSYMAYARQVSDGKFSLTVPENLKSSADWYLKTKLEKWLVEEANLKSGYSLPFTDITISRDGEFIGVIATDDDNYYQSPSIKDSHVYTPFTLSAKNWKSKGVFSRNYWQNKEGTEEELRIFVNQVMNS